MTEREFDWADPYPSGRFGIFLAGDDIQCADEGCTSRGYSYISPTERDSFAIVWEHKASGTIVHYRCAPQEEKQRYDITHRWPTHEASLAHMHMYGMEKGLHCKWKGVIDDINGEWLLIGASYGPDPHQEGGYAHTYHLILWRRSEQQRLL